MENTEYFNIVLGNIKQPSIKGLFDVLAKTCIDYHPDNIFLEKIQAILQQLSDGNQVEVIDIVVTKLTEAAKRNLHMTVREFELCLDAEVERFMRREYEELGMRGLHVPIAEMYEQGEDGNKSIIGVSHEIYDTDGNQAVFSSQLKIKKGEEAGISNMYFVDSICNSPSVSNMLSRVLLESIYPKISTKKNHTSYTWGHLYHTLYGLDLIVFCKRDKEKAKALHSIYKNLVTLDTIHGQIKNRKFADGKFNEWEKNDADRLICQEIAKWLQPVVDYISPNNSEMELW